MEGGGIPGDAITQLVSYLLSLGPYGILLGVLGYFGFRKDKRVDELNDVIRTMAENYATRVSENTNALNALRELLLANGNGRRGRSSE